MSDGPTPEDPRTGRRIEPIIEAAEQAATAIIAEAEARAARYVEESRRRTEAIATEQAREMWSLTDTLIGRAEEVKRQSDELLLALNRTRRGVRAALDAAGGAPAPARGSELISRGRGPGPGQSSAVSEEARTLALQMAVAGKSREEIAARLESELGISDGEAILDSIFGSA